MKKKNKSQTNQTNFWSHKSDKHQEECQYFIIGKQNDAITIQGTFDPKTG